MWGLDLSGSLQGAGGVGGLLKVYDGATSKHCYPGYDGNGNVTVLVDGDNGQVVANYEYGPFGELLRATGLVAKNNPFRFSTKYQDDETDFLYYGYRYYNPSTGRWVNRDPIGESGFDLLHAERGSLVGDGPNLYEFSRNRPIDRYDRNGLTAPPGYEVWGTKFPDGPCCHDRCNNEGDIDHVETRSLVMPGNWDARTQMVVDGIKEAIKDACTSRARYAKDPTHVVIDLVDKYGQQHLLDREGVRFYTILISRECRKGKCRKWGLGSLLGKCAPLSWSKLEASEPRECKPTSRERHQYNTEAFATVQDANAALKRCAEEHANEIWSFE
jgi:RHS repeat-associated protein